MPTAAMKLLFEHPLIHVWIHERRKIVHHRINRPILAEELSVVQGAFTSGTEALKTYRATKWLSDDRLQLVMPSDVQEWCQTVWFPMTRSLGWKYWAVIQPDSAVAKLFIGRLMTRMPSLGITAQTFGDVPDALAWLDKFDTSIGPQSK